MSTATVAVPKALLWFLCGGLFGASVATAVTLGALGVTAATYVAIAAILQAWAMLVYAIFRGL